MSAATVALTFLKVVSAQVTDIYNQPPATVLGCECSGSCTTNILFQCDVAPFCSVKSEKCKKGTAPNSIQYGHYDYCVYPPYEDYEKLSAKQKQDIVLKHVTADATAGSYPNPLSILTGIMGESVVVSFNSSADVFPEKRSKWIHSVGVHGGIRFDSTGNHPYTGLFQGAEYGVVRFSSAKAPDSAGVAPGMGVKFFRDGRPSANFVAMYALDGQPCSDSNFFAHDWHNHVGSSTALPLQLIAKKFWQASYCPVKVGISDLASSEGSQGKFPYMLTFRALVAVDCPCTDYKTCLANLMKLATGTKVFEVSATPAPGGNPEVIGHISLTTQLTTSKFGDESLFFKHQLMEEDFALEPAWLAAIDRKKECAMDCTSTHAPTIGDGCHSPFGFNRTQTDMLSSDANVVV